MPPSKTNETTTPLAEPARASICIEPHHTAIDGVPTTFRRGAKIRSDSEAVRRNPRCWIDADATGVEIAEAQNALYADIVK